MISRNILILLILVGCSLRLHASNNEEIRKIVNGLVSTKILSDGIEFDWTDSLFSLAIIRSQNNLKIDKKWIDVVETFYQKHNKEKPTITSPDLLASVMGAVELAGKGKVFKNILDSGYDFLKTEPINKIGTLNHIGSRHRFHPLLPLTKNFVSDSIWTDSLVMYVVAGTMLAKLKSDEGLLNMLRGQHKIFNKYLFDGKLYKHAYFLSDKSIYPNGDYYWLRGNAWVLLSLVELIELETKAEVQAEYIKIYRDIFRGLLSYQNSNGLFNTILTKETIDNYPDVSGNSIVLYAALKAKRLGILSNDDFIEKLYAALMEKVEHRNDTYRLKGISGPTNAFKYYWYYTKLVGTRENLGYGLGPFILAMDEYVKYNSSKGEL